jgi:hypothetical protein
MRGKLKLFRSNSRAAGFHEGKFQLLGEANDLEKVLGNIGKMVSRKMKRVLDKTQVMKLVVFLEF